MSRYILLGRSVLSCIHLKVGRLVLIAVLSLVSLSQPFLSLGLKLGNSDPASQLRINNIHKSRFQTRPANQKPINIPLLRQILTILLTHTAPIDNPRVLRCLATNLLAQPLTNRGVDFLRLGGRGDFSGAYGPHWFIGNDDFGPGVGGDLGGDGGELPGYDGEGFIGFPLLFFWDRESY